MRRPRPLLLSTAAALVFIAALTSSLRAAGPARTAAPRGTPAAQASDTGNYVGPGSCSAVACHGATRPVAGARILQTEYSSWIAQDRHARATDALGNPISQRMARILGIGNPQQAQKCLSCHSLDVPAALRGRNFAASRLTARPDEVAALASQARGIVDRGLSRALTSAPTGEMAAAMLKGIFGDAPAIAGRGDRAAEQGAMAAKVLATAIARGRGQDPAAMKGAFTDLFKEFESPSAYAPAAFVAAMKKAELAISNR